MPDTAEPAVYGTPESVLALFAALAAAAAACEWVEKRKRDGVNYAYASAESIVAEADRVFGMHGLAVVPGACVVEQRFYKKQAEERSVLVLTREFRIVHKDGGSIIGGGVAAIGANVGGTPPQAMNSAETMCFAYFVKTLLRMPRQDEEDADHPRSRSAAREEEEREPPPPAKPAVRPPTTERKVTKVLAAVAAIKDVAGWDKVRERWDREVLAARSPDDDLGYTADDCAAVKQALADAAARVGA
jgi:hypothetical protein